jgi:HEAT repeat protein
MLDKKQMTGLLEKYDSFLNDVMIGVLRIVDDSNIRIERKVIDFVKGKNFPVQIDTLIEYMDKLAPENVREKVVESLWDLHSTFLDLVVFIGAEGSRQTVYMPLIKMMEKQNPENRAFAMASLCSFDFPEAVNNLAARFEELSSELRWVSLVLLKKRWEDRFIPVFLKALEDRDPEVVRIAVMALGKATALSALTKIRKLIDHSSELVVITAIKAIVEMGDREASKLLKQLFEKTSNQRIKATVVSAYAEIEGENALRFLEKALDNPESRVRANAVIAFKKKAEKHEILPDSIIDKIKHLMVDTDHRVRADCIQALWSMGMADNLDEIEKMLVCENDQTRSAGAYLCGKLKLQQMKKFLETLTGDKSWSVRKMAALALLGLGDSGRTILESLMDNGNSDQQIIAAYATGLGDDQGAIDKLIDQSRSGSEVAEKATGLLLKLSRPAS